MILVLSSLAGASPLNPWSTATAPGTALIDTYVYAWPGAVQLLPYGSVGLGDHLDLYAGAGATITPDGTAGSLEVFPRWFPDPHVALAAHLYWTPGVDGVIVAPEIHANAAADRFSIVVNAGWRPVLGVDDWQGTVPVIVAPEVYLADRFSLFAEVDPTFSLIGDDVAMLVVPGFGMTLDQGAHHSLSVGLQVPVLPDVAAASLGALYCFTFPAKSGT